MSRLRAHSEPASPPQTPYDSRRSGLPHITAQDPTTSTSSPRARPTESSTSSLQSSLSNLTLTAQTRSPLAQYLEGEGYPGSGRRSETPSVTSVSDDGEDDVRMQHGEEEDVRVKRWLERGRGKGKGKERETGEGIVEGLPLEILAHIMKLLHHPRDLFAALQVSRTWCLTAYPLLWSRPSLTHPHQLASLSRTLVSLAPSLPYATAIRRLNLSMVSNRLNDYLIDGMEYCTRVDRLTVTNAEGLSTQALKRVLGNMRDVTAVDLSGTSCVENTIVRRIGESMDRLQGLNLTGCKGVGDEGLKVIAERRKNFRRLKVGHCHRITDLSIVPITRSCPLLIEIDLSYDPQITDASLYSVFLHLSHLRELRLVGNSDITARGIPNLAELADDIEDDPKADEVGSNTHFPWYTVLNGHRIMPRSTTFEHLRIVDLMSCSKLDDEAVDNLVWNAPKIRHLVLAKCPLLTDRSLESIARLGRHLHHLHLGHAALITDAGVTKLARACTRLRYIDVACCPNLTDLSVLELAENLQKMRRIGLVKATHITDEAIYALVERHATLERIHLSYCDKISVKAIAFLLNRLLRLTHLSLTGVAAFKVPELQQFCRPTPSEFTESQRESFCVYSGHGIGALRKYLNSLYPPGGGATSDEGSRRGSGSSQSSLTGPADPPSFITAQPRSSISARGRREARDARNASMSGVGTVAAWSAMDEQVGGELPGSDHLTSSQRAERRSSQSAASTRVSAPVFRYASRPASPNSVPGLPGNVLTASGPNFLVHPASVSWAAPRRASNANLPASPGSPSAANNRRGSGPGDYSTRAGGERRTPASVSNSQVSVSRGADFGPPAPGSPLARESRHGSDFGGSSKSRSEAARKFSTRSAEREQSGSDGEEEDSRGGARKWVTGAFGR